MVALRALLAPVRRGPRVVARRRVRVLEQHVRERERERVPVQEPLDAVDRVRRLDALHAERDRALRHGGLEPRARVLARVLGLVRAHRVGQHVAHHVGLHVVEPLGLPVGRLVQRRAAEAARVLLVRRAVLDQAEPVRLLRELHVLVGTQQPVRDAVAPVRRLHDAHRRKDVARPAVRLVLHRRPHVARHHVRPRQRHRRPQTLQARLVAVVHRQPRQHHAAKHKHAHQRHRAHHQRRRQKRAQAAAQTPRRPSGSHKRGVHVSGVNWTVYCRRVVKGNKKKRGKEKRKKSINQNERKKGERNER